MPIIQYNTNTISTIPAIQYLQYNTIPIIQYNAMPTNAMQCSKIQ